MVAESPTSAVHDSAFSDSRIISVLGPKPAENSPAVASNNLRHRISATGDGGDVFVSEYSGAVSIDLISQLQGQQPDFAGPNENVPNRGGRILNRDDWLLMPGETHASYLKRILTEGHTVPDAFMTCACAQVGQILLNSPSALFKMGLVAGGISMAVFLMSGYWTIYQFMCLYMEYKKAKMLDGSWWETNGKHVKVVQMFEVFDHFLGLWAKMSSGIILMITLIGLLMTQINACAVNMYFVDSSRPKRQWALIYGGILAFTMIFFPRFNHFRLANIFGLVTVACMSVFIIVTTAQRGYNASIIEFWPRTSQNYFTGAAVWLTILGTHAVTFETLESMEQPRHFKTSFSSAWIWTMLVTIPSSFLCNFSYSDFYVYLDSKNVLSYSDNIFSLLENQAEGLPGQPGANPPKFGVLWNLLYPATPSQAKYAMAILMNIHQFVAFALYGTSMCFIWEKIFGVHTKPWYIRIPCRVPLTGLIWFLAILAPFYGAINSLLASLAIPFLGFVLPSLAMLSHYKSRKQLSESILQPYSWVMWSPGWLLDRIEGLHPRLALLLTPWGFCNLFCLLVYSGFGGSAIYYSIVLISDNFNLFGAFAECYACFPKTPYPPPRTLPPQPSGPI